jgi:ATP adenylyltransferase
MEKLWAPWRLEYIQGPEDDQCVFCIDDNPVDDKARLIVSRGEQCYVIMNRYPYSNGHMMVSPYRHLSDPASLTHEEIQEMHRLMVNCQSVLTDCCAAQGFNVGWNFGEAAGAGVTGHIHMHVVPRWSGDCNFMTTLAETRVIPQHIERTYSLLTKAFLKI